MSGNFAFVATLWGSRLFRQVFCSSGFGTSKCVDIIRLHKGSFVVFHYKDPKPASRVSVWFLVGNGGMDYWDYYWGLYRDYYNKDPFPHSLLST